MLHHDTAPARKALRVKQFLGQKFITEMEYPPSSLDLVLSDLWLFPEMSALKG
jgi:hypothetical protein